MRSRCLGPLFLVGLLSAINLNWARAQPPEAPSGRRASQLSSGPAFPSSDETSEASFAFAELPDAPGWQVADEKSGRSISGTVTDMNGAEVRGAQVTLSSADAKTERNQTTDEAGFFSFADVKPGTYKLAVISTDFSSWFSKEIVLALGESYDAPQITLRLALATTNVDVVYTQHDLAEAELKAQERQRVMGVFPNFYVSYVGDAVPLSAGQKFQLALRQEADPVVILGSAFAAGLEMSAGDYQAYGNGAKGFFTRMGAAYGDGFNSSLIAGAILPSLLHQDPRYFYKGTGSKRSRALYAASMVVICKGDNGRWQPNYSNVFGNLAAAGISNAYYPAADRGATLTVVNTSIGFAFSAVGNLFQEFLLKKITPAAQP